jgi:hypothetical protein
MQNCSNTCAGVTPTAANGVIFRGGDTWHFGNSGATPYAGVVTTCAGASNVPAGLCLDGYNLSSSGTPVYYGVDKSWFSGGAWARPILTADNSFCNSGTIGTMPDGATCTQATNTTYYTNGASHLGQDGYYVSSCPYQVGSSNNLVDVGFSKYVILDNFELNGICENHVGQPGDNDTAVRYGSAQAPLYFLNLYIHGASHLQFAGPNNGGAQCNGSTVCTNMWTFDGSVNNGSVGETIALNSVDYADSDGGGNRFKNGGGYIMAYNVVRYQADAIPGNVGTIHDNLFEYFYEDGHSNLFETNDVGLSGSGITPIYNNVFRHIENTVTSGGGVGLWPGPASGVTDYIFNNLMYDVGCFEYLNQGGTGLAIIQGNYLWFNNTWQTNCSQPILRFPTPCYTNGTIAETNNHYIDDQSQYLNASSCSFGSTTPLLLSNATATSDGYTSSQTFAYSPTSGSSPTVGQGTNETSGYIAALTTAGLTAAATAAGSDMTYACSYAGSGATPVCPARTVVPRPGSGTWDIGAYEFAASANAVDSISGVIFSGAKLQ